MRALSLDHARRGKHDQMLSQSIMEAESNGCYHVE
jgi:hypothetical protein